MKTDICLIETPSQLDDFCKERKIYDHDRLLIQVFLGTPNREAVQNIQHILQKRFPHAHVIGATSDGAIMEGRVVEAGHTVLSFTRFEYTRLRTALVHNTREDCAGMGEELARKLLDDETRAVLCFTDGLYTNGEEFLNGFSRNYPEVVVAGGMAADNGTLKETYVFTLTEYTRNGAVGAALDNPDLRLHLQYGFDWIPIGKRMKITRSRKNRVYEIDGEPAYKIYAKYLGNDIARSLPLTGIEFPLIFERSDTVIGRAVIQKLPDGSLVFAGDIAKGETVRFGVGNSELIQQNALRHTKALSHHPVETIFVYSCMVRRRFMGRGIEVELKPLQSLAPTAGFFTHGEFFYSHHRTHLMNQTVTMLALSESDRKQTSAIPRQANVSSAEYGTVRALAHLANTVSKELENLNAQLEKKIREKTNELLHQVYTDRLTGLPNRVKLIRDLNDRIGSYLVMIDIDNFTAINDFFGFETGDYVLRSLAEAIGGQMDHHCMGLYKLPADKYVILCKEFEKDQSFTAWLDALFNALKQHTVEYRGHTIMTSVTMGVARVKNETEGLVHANVALKHAKEMHRNYYLYEENRQLSIDIQKNLQMAGKISRAIAERRIVPYYQPIYDLRSGKIVKCESLVRMIEEDGSVVTPGLFLPVAITTRQYSEITHLMMEQVIQQHARTPGAFTLNISVEDIYNDETRAFLLEQLPKMESDLTFEIIENQEICSDPIITDFVERVKKLGGEISIDDFGSGYANFHYMTRISPHVLKIDGSLIRNIHQDKNARILVEAIVAFSHKMGIKTVAEFVHSAEVLETVRAIGIDCAQGYYLGEPQPYPSGF